MPTGYIFSEKDMNVLRRVIDDHRSRTANQRPKGTTEGSWEDRDDYQASEVRIAIPQTGEGIPGLSSEPGGFGDLDEPGSGVCDIYQLVEGKLNPTGLEETVYNLSEIALSRRWVPVAKDKYGKWIAIQGSGGIANESIDYEVIEAGCPAFAAGQSQWVYAVVLRVDCQHSVEVGDVVQIFDPDEDLYNLPVDLLVGARGLAFLRRNTGFTNIVCAVVPEPYDDCVWIGATIKCREEIYSQP